MTAVFGFPTSSSVAQHGLMCLSWDEYTLSVFLVGSACDSLDLAFIFDNDSPRELHLV